MAHRTDAGNRFDPAAIRLIADNGGKRQRVLQSSGRVENAWMRDDSDEPAED